MSISQSVLDEHKQSNVLLAEGYEFLCDVLQRFLDNDSPPPERETFLLARLDDGSYCVQRVDRINAYLSRQDADRQYRELYRPLADLNWPKVKQVMDVNGPMTDKEVADWKRRRKGQALVVVDGENFLALIYEPEPMRSGPGKSLRELFPDGIGSVHAAMAEESSALPAEESFAPAKGLEEIQPVFERELAMAAPVEALEMVVPVLEVLSLPTIAPDESQPPAFALSVPFHTDIRFANWLKPGQTRPLTVQLTKEKATTSISAGVVNVGFVEEFTAETLHIHLDAPNFSERTNTWQKAVEVYSFQDSDKATFILTAGQDEGERQISIDFRHRDRLIGNTRFVVQVSSQEPVSAGPAAADALTFRQPPSAVEIPQFPPPPPDVEIRIRADGKRLTFELSSPHQAVDASNAPMGGVEMTVEPLAYMQERYDELNQWAGGQPADASVIAEISDRLTAIGNNLFINLFPDKLKRAYWKLVKLRKQGVLKSLHIVSDEPWIPWEMVKPVDMDEDEADDFLAQGWQVSRWLAGPGQVDRLRIDTARLVAPSTDLTQVKREVDFFGTLPARRIAIGETLRQLAQVRQIAKEGVELLHFSTHGRLNAKSIDSSSIMLENNTELRPDDLVGEAVFGLRKRRPLVFMNTCHGARMGFSLAGLGGWAGQMINQVKAGIFIGAQWEVDDALAADFALRFYSELQNGETLGSAFHTARQEIREKAPANSTWLAYTLYGDPNIRVAWGRGGGSDQ
jgi:hypothetical protein